MSTVTIPGRQTIAPQRPGVQRSAVRKPGRFFLALFFCMALVQVAAPASMIARRELILRTGRAFKFQTVAVDPYDAFRGRYVALRLEQDQAAVPQGINLPPGSRAFALIEEDADGFARFSMLTTERPEGEPYLKVVVQAVNGNTAYLNLPIDRYYMDETSAPEAENAYRAHSQRGNQTAYVVVRVKSGEAVIEDLYVAGRPIAEFVRAKAP